MLPTVLWDRECARIIVGVVWPAHILVPDVLGLQKVRKRVVNFLSGLESPANYHVLFVGDSIFSLFGMLLGEVFGGLSLLLDGLGLARLKR